MSNAKLSDEQWDKVLNFVRQHQGVSLSATSEMAAGSSRRCSGCSAAVHNGGCCRRFRGGGTRFTAALRVGGETGCGTTCWRFSAPMPTWKASCWRARWCAPIHARRAPFRTRPTRRIRLSAVPGAGLSAKFMPGSTPWAIPLTTYQLVPAHGFRAFQPICCKSKSNS